MSVLCEVLRTTHKRVIPLHVSIGKKLLSTRLETLRKQLKDEKQQMGTKKNLKKPFWLKAQPPRGDNYEYLRSTVRSLKLATVCEEAKCPNIGGE